MKHDTCGGSLRRRRRVLERGMPELMTTATRAVVSVVRCKEEIGYFCCLHTYLCDLDGLELAIGVDLPLGLLDKPFFVHESTA